MSLLFYFQWKILLANNVDPDQMPHYVASDLGLHCLSLTLSQVSRQEWVKASTLECLLSTRILEKVLQHTSLKLYNTHMKINYKLRTTNCLHTNVKINYNFTLLLRKPKLHAIFAFMSAIGLRTAYLFSFFCHETDPRVV